MRIGVITFVDSVGWHYRARLPMQALAQRGHEVRWVDDRAPGFEPAQLEDCDVVHLYRGFDQDTQRLVAHVRAAGVALWWDNDDDIAAIPKGMPKYKEYGGARGARIFAEMRKVMASCDLVTTPSAVIAEGYRKLGIEHVRVVENYPPDSFARAQGTGRRRNGEVVIGWTAGAEHRIDVEQLPLRPALQRLIEAHPHVRVHSLGISLGLPERYTNERNVPLDELGAHNAQYDVGIAPIADIQINRARSNIKVKEYAAAGVPWLASPIGPYSGLGEKQGGRLVADDGWYEALEQLVLDAKARRKLASRAAKWGKKETIGANVKVWEAALQEAVARARARTT